MSQRGKVLGVYNKEFGSVTLWSYRLQDNDTFWRCGQEQPPIEKGDFIEFTADANNNVNVASIKPATGEPTKEAPKAAPATIAPAKTGTPYAHARADAARIVCAALAHDHLPHPSNAAKGKRLDLLVGYVEEVTKALLKQEENNK